VTYDQFFIIIRIQDFIEKISGKLVYFWGHDIEWNLQVILILCQIKVENYDAFLNDRQNIPKPSETYLKHYVKYCSIEIVFINSLLVFSGLIFVFKSCEFLHTCISVCMYLNIMRDLWFKFCIFINFKVYTFKPQF
jgi:hypothetical protein